MGAAVDNLISLDELASRGMTMADAEAKGIHVTSSTCWCDPDTEYVKGK